MLSDIQTLGQALVKAFQQPLTRKQEKNAVDKLRLKVSIELAEACMNKLWEENLVLNALQDKMALKVEQLEVAEEKSVAQNSLYAVTKRKLNSVET